MLFNSLLFVCFFVLVLLLHWSLPHRARNGLLLLASYVFYASWNWKFLALIWFSTGLDFAMARIIAGSDARRVRRAALLTSVIGNLGLLGFFKYYNFFVDSLDALLAPLGTSAAGLHLDIVLPMGISFYTFQTLGYTIDVYRGSQEPARSLSEFALYVCFFPQLIAGPIERAGHLLPQIRGARRVDRTAVEEGLVLLAWGYVKKTVFADNLARVVDPVYAAGAGPSGYEVVVATVAFAFQVYADFSAYADIARGTARLLGFELMRNFDVPYSSRDMAEFWRRWHISLSTWLRDYLYVPLGGSRRGEARVATNLFLTLFLSGLWHGSDGTFLAFGAYHGSLVVLTRWFRKWKPVREDSPLWHGALLSFTLFTVGLVFFRGRTFAQCMSLFGAVLFDFAPGPLSASDLGDLVLLTACAVPLIVFDLLHRRHGTDVFAMQWSPPVKALAALAVFYLIVLAGRAAEMEFVYFQF